MVAAHEGTSTDTLTVYEAIPATVLNKNAFTSHANDTYDTNGGVLALYEGTCADTRTVYEAGRAMVLNKNAMVGQVTYEVRESVTDGTTGADAAASKPVYDLAGPGAESYDQPNSVYDAVLPVQVIDQRRATLYDTVPISALSAQGSVGSVEQPATGGVIYQADEPEPRAAQSTASMPVYAAVKSKTGSRRTTNGQKAEAGLPSATAARPPVKAAKKKEARCM